MGRRKHRSKGGNNLVARVSKSKDVDYVDDTSTSTTRDVFHETEAAMVEKKHENEKISRSPINVNSRLAYPLISWTENEDNDEKQTLQLTIKPRFVFVSGLCAVCLDKCKLFCERCRMVSYCSTKHRTQGLLKHRELCEILAEIRSSIASTLSLESSSDDSNAEPEQYRIYRLQLLGILQSNIQRPLELWEKEIVLYPRVCRTCRRFSEKLICCVHCGMEFYCEEHSEDHKNWCEQFQVFQKILLLQHRYGSVEPKIPQRIVEKSIELSNYDFDKLMSYIYGFDESLCSYHWQMDSYTYSILSHVSTIPLTALYSMQISCQEWKNKTDWTIHVLGAELEFEGINLYVWEKFFLHFLPNLKKLNLILIGPELRLPKGVPLKLLSTVKLCNECRSVDRAVIVTFKPETLYHSLFRDNECIKEPDLICAFNPGLYRKTGFAGQDTWLETIREFCGKSTPVTVTSYTENEIHWEMARITSLADVQILLQPQRNPFASIKPDRNFVSDDINPLIYKNYYIAIVKGKSSLS